jgi:uncharacterized protein
MASTNQSPFYQRAEEEFLAATTDDEKIKWLEEMIRECPKHKSSESMLSNLKNRLRKLKENAQKRKSAGKSSSSGIKKSEMQCVLLGFPNTGKSSIFEILTGQKTKISPHPFSTIRSLPGTIFFEDIKIQIIDGPAFPNHDKNIANSADTIILVVNSVNQITESEKFLVKSRQKIILIFNKADLLSASEKRKIEATLNSKYKIDFIFIAQNSSSAEIELLKKKIFNSFPIIRIYTKEPKKEPSKDPMILNKDSTLKEAVEKIRKGMVKKFVSCKIWGPSSKFGGQIIGLNHILKDKDVIELKTE